MVDIKELTVNTNKEREQWIQLLDSVVAYHWDMSGQFDPDIKTPNADSDMEKVAAIHRALARSITDCIKLIQMWDIKEDDDIKRVDE